MNVLVPAYLAAAGLLALPFLLHLYRRQPRREIVFPTLRFLGAEAVRDSQRYRLAKILLLILRLLAIATIVLAFARPYWLLPHSAQSRAVVVIWDNSYSQQAKGRRASEDAWLRRRLEELEAPDELGVLAAGPTPTWLAPLSAKLEAGRIAAGSLAEGDGKVDYRPAIDVAAAALSLAPTPSKQILLVGDGQAVSWASADLNRPLPPGVELITSPQAEIPGRQAALKDLKVARLGTDRVAVEATVVGFAPDEDVRTATVYDGDTLLGVAKVVVHRGSATPIHALFPLSRPMEAHAFRVSLDPDDLPIDDTAYASLPSLASRTVLLAPSARRGVDYVSVAMRSVQGGLSAVNLLSLPSEGEWPSDAVAILRGEVPFRAPNLGRLDAFIGRGGSACLLCDGSRAQAEWLRRRGVTIDPEIPASSDELHLRDLALDHPLFTVFSGQNLLPLLQPTFHRGWRLSGSALEPLARWPDGSIAIAVLSTGSGSVLLTGFDESRTVSDFPLSVGFVPFLHGAVVWLSDSSQRSEMGVIVGQRVPLYASGTWSAILGPDSAGSRPVQDFVTPEMPGVYVFTQKSGSRLYSVNLDTTESDLTPWPDAAQLPKLMVAGVNRPQAAPRPTGSPLAVSVEERDAWWWLLAVAALFLVAEQLVANRLAEQ